MPKFLASRFAPMLIFLITVGLLSPIVWMFLPSNADTAQLQIVEVLSLELLEKEEPLLWNSLYVHWNDDGLVVKTMNYGLKLLAGYICVLTLLILSVRDSSIAQIIMGLGTFIPIFILLFVYFIWGIIGIYTASFSPLLHKGLIFLALLSAILAFKQTFFQPQTLESQVSAYMGFAFLLFGFGLFWVSRVGIEMKLSNPEKKVHIRYSGYFSSLDREVSYSEIQTLEWRYQIIRGETPMWAWALYITPYQEKEDEDPLVSLAPKDDAILTFHQTMEANSNNESLLIDYDTLDIERTQTFTSLCTVISREVPGNCKPLLKLPPRPFFRFY